MLQFISLVQRSLTLFLQNLIEFRRSNAVVSVKLAGERAHLKHAGKWVLRATYGHQRSKLNVYCIFGRFHTQLKKGEPSLSFQQVAKKKVLKELI